MDITFQTGEGRFNYRVCAVITHNGKLLVMHDERMPYYYLPGGRVRLHETAEQAVLREIKEELQIDAEIIRPLWLNQGFFTEDASQEKFHEICLYFLVDTSKTNLLKSGEKFDLTEGKLYHSFEWLSYCELKDKYLYPEFIKKKIYDLPEHLELITEYQ